MQFMIIEVGKHLAYSWRNKALQNSWTTILQRAVIISNCGQLTTYLLYRHTLILGTKKKIVKNPLCQESYTVKDNRSNCR